MNRLSLCRYAAVVLLAAVFLASFGGPAVAQKYAPLPQKLLGARTVFLINDSQDLKAYDVFYRELTKWARLKVVDDRNAADVVAVLTSSATYGLSVSTGMGVQTGNITTGTATSVAVPSTFLHLRVFEQETGEVLWSDSSEKWLSAGRAPLKLVSNLRKRIPVSK